MSANQSSLVNEKRTVVEVFVTTLFTQNQQATESAIRKNRHSAQEPNERVADQVDLLVILDPEVLQDIYQQ